MTNFRASNLDNNASGQCVILGVEKNCSDLRSVLYAHGHPTVLSCSVTGLLLNAFIFLVFFHAGTKQRSGTVKQAHIHLSSLAVSDMTIGVVYILGKLVSMPQ